MTREEARKILGEEATEEQISNLLNNVHNSLKTKEDEIKTLREKVDSQGDYDSIKAQLDEINKAKMSEEEKIAAKLKEAEQKKAEADVIYNTAKAKEILSGFNVPEDLIKSLVTADSTSTINNANLLKEQMVTLQEKVTKDVTDKIASLDVKPNPTNVPQGDDVMTREKFEKMTMLEQKQWKDENLDAYHEMFS